MIRLTNRRGSSLIEFALGLAVLAPVVVGLLRLTVTSYVVQQMQDAVREGAEFASRQRLSVEPDEELRRTVANVVVYGKAEGGTQPRIAGLVPGNVRLTVERQGVAPRAVSVSIADYRAAGDAVRIDQGPQASYPYLGPAIQ